MIKQYIKQAIQMLRETPLITAISISGTALSICMILLIVLLFQVRTAGYAPETARDRTLYVGGVTSFSKADKQKRAVGGLSPEMVKECFYSLKTPAVVTAYTSFPSPVSIPGKRLFKPYQVKRTDAAFWNAFSFRFLSGQAFAEPDFLSAIPQAVVSEATAKRIYGSVDVIGKTLIIGYINYRICGVVEDVSRAASTAFGEIWIPYTTSKEAMSSEGTEKINGSLAVCLVAKDKSDFQAIRDELKAKVEMFNTTKVDLYADLLDAPITHFDILAGSNGNKKAGTRDFLLGTGVLLLFLLFVPALNLTGVTQSAVQKRRAEIGVRKAFGATSGMVLSQILCENCIMTLAGGLIGLCLSFPVFYLAKDFLLPMGNVELNAEMLLRPEVFAAALFFCLLLNLLSAGIPALKISRSTIVNTLKDGNNEC